MPQSVSLKGLELTEEEAFALLELVMTSPVQLNSISEIAIHKLAAFCRSIEEPESF